MLSEHQIVNENFIHSTAVKPNSVDLIVTSPPYNLGIAYDTHQDSMPEAEYEDFTRDWLAQCYNSLKPDGRLCINVPIDTARGFRVPISTTIINAAIAEGFSYKFTIIWFDNHLSNRTAWGSFESASSPYVITPVELIIVFYKHQWKKLDKGVSTITRQEFIDWTKGWWEFRGAQATLIGHPAPFPIDLPERCIKLFSYKDDVVLDPFLGSGTTLIACEMLGRRGIGFDISSTYCEIAQRRLEAAAYQQPSLLALLEEKTTIDGAHDGN